MLRTFFAAPVAATHALERALAQLERFGGPVKPVAAANLHVTLKFLGETPEELVLQLVEVLRRVGAGKPTREVRLHGLGAFPFLDRPSVIWAGLRGAELLANTTAELEASLAPLGFPREERPFHPHLTLARVRAKPPREMLDYLRKQAAAEFGVATLGRLVLFRSDLRPAGPEYTPLESVELV